MLRIAVGSNSSAADRAFVLSLMKRVAEPGKIAGWIFTYEEKGKRMKA